MQTAQLNTSPAIQNLFYDINHSFVLHADPITAAGQQAYLKNQFLFYGLKMPIWRKLSQQIIRNHPTLSESELVALIQLCYQSPYRELHYFSLQLLEKQIKQVSPSFLSTLEQLILSNSWWDTVDWISKLVGIYFKQYPELIHPTIERWMKSDQLWLQRVCLLFQLHYKQDTNAKLLFHLITQVANSNQFFLQKAAGWALRQYSKVNPEAVITFVNSSKLSSLTRKEALRLIIIP